MTLEPLAAPQTLTSHARTAVLSAIGDGRLEPGGLYSVAQLAEQLGVSRTPVREALLMLEREGRVRFERNRGVRVLAPTAHDIAEVFELRLLLEVPTTAAAAGRVDLDALTAAYDAMAEAAAAADEPAFMDRDERFHGVILAATGNRRLVAAVAQLRDAVRGRGASTVGRSRDLPEILGEHQAILEALREGDGDRAAAAMRYHLRRTGDLLVAQEGSGGAQEDQTGVV